MRYLSGWILLIMIFSCSQNEEAVKQKYIQKGKLIAAATQAELLKNVSSAMKRGGPVYAIEFCNLKALALKDSLSKVHNCEIRRISERYRNPFDMPRTETEAEQLKQYTQTFAAGETLQPAVHQFNDRVEFYQPIMLAREACLKCHGSPETDISPETMAILETRYPDDRATGFALNDFRGAWKITFAKN